MYTLVFRPGESLPEPGCRLAQNLFRKLIACAETEQVEPGRPLTDIDETFDEIVRLAGALFSADGLSDRRLVVEWVGVRWPHLVLKNSEYDGIDLALGRNAH